MIKQEFLDRLKKQISEKDYISYIDEMSKAETYGFTLNLSKLSISSIDIDFIIDRFNAKKVFENKYYAYLIYDKEYLTSKNIFPGKDPLYHAGLYYIQEPSAAKVLTEVDFKENDVVLDLCASPGGKTCEALYCVKKDAGGLVVANEIKRDRARVLSSNIERMGFDNAIVLNNTPSELSNVFINTFDKIIVDAPCSGEGMFRKSEEARKQWSEELVLSCARTQKEILDYAYKMLKSDGMIIYSTCTFSKEENDDNVSYMLSKYADLSLIKKEQQYPFNSLGEGQFFAIFKRSSKNVDYNVDSMKKENLKDLHILRYGIEKNENINGRIVPTHASTHNDNINFENTIELDDFEIEKYLHGEVIRKNVNFSGYCKITYKRLGVGLGKVTDNVIKNHYPKGLRNM